MSVLNHFQTHEENSCLHCKTLVELKWKANRLNSHLDKIHVTYVVR